MNKELSVTQSISINAPIEEVWDALTDPRKIKKYFFGVDVVSDWKAGEPIIFKGEFENGSFEDKGTILEIKPSHLIQYDYWSSWSGLEDLPENYSLVTYKLEEKNSVTELKLSQEGFANEEARNHSEKAWEQVLANLKELVEEK